jgi:hypothetical protein
VGCEARKSPAGAEVFFLDFYLYRTYRELAHALENVIPEGHKGEPLTKPKKQNPRKLPSRNFSY